MIRSLILFAHVAGVLTMFAALALEAFGGKAALERMPRSFRFAAPVTLLSGFYLGARYGVLTADWMLASYAGIAAMVAAGALTRRSDALRRMSLRLRTAFALAVVFLMIANPGVVASLVALAVAPVLALVAPPPRTFIDDAAMSMGSAPRDLKSA